MTITQVSPCLAGETDNFFVGFDRPLTLDDAVLEIREELAESCRNDRKNIIATLTGPHMWHGTEKVGRVGDYITLASEDYEIEVTNILNQEQARVFMISDDNPPFVYSEKLHSYLRRKLPYTR